MNENNDDMKVFDGEIVNQGTGETTAVERANGQAIRQIRTAYQTAVAVQKPRDFGQVMKRVMAEADAAGDNFYYRWPVKNRKTGETKIVEGASVNCLLSVARAMGNCALEIEEDSVINGEFVFKMAFIDLESGCTFQRHSRSRIPTKALGNFDDDRSYTMAYQAAQSKAMRGTIKCGVPGWLVAEAKDRAMAAEEKKIAGQGLEAAISGSLKFFAGYGVTLDRIEATLNHKRSEFTPDDILTLRNFARQIKDGESSADQLFPIIAKVDEVKPPVPPPAPAPPVEEKPKRAYNKKGAEEHNTTLLGQEWQQKLRSRFELLPHARREEIMLAYHYDDWHTFCEQCPTEESAAAFIREIESALKAK